MGSSTRVAAATELLQAHGADGIDHPGGTLFDHLLRVRLQLEEWGAPAAVQLAGLCHACYGTDGFGVSLLDTSQRPELEELIGAEAEQLVYLYGSCDRAATYPNLGQDVVRLRDRFSGRDVTPTRPSLQAFAEITAANELDVIHHNAEFAKQYGAALTTLVDRMRRLLSEGALQAWRDADLR